MRYQKLDGIFFAYFQMMHLEEFQTTLEEIRSLSQSGYMMEKVSLKVYDVISDQYYQSV